MVSSFGENVLNKGKPFHFWKGYFGVMSGCEKVRQIQTYTMKTYDCVNKSGIWR